MNAEINQAAARQLSVAEEIEPLATLESFIKFLSQNTKTSGYGDIVAERDYKDNIVSFRQKSPANDSGAGGT